jgi:hypothetical protein
MNCLINQVKNVICWVWQYMSIIPAFRRLRQEDCEFKTSLGYIVRPCVKTK